MPKKSITVTDAAEYAAIKMRNAAYATASRTAAEKLSDDALATRLEELQKHPIAFGDAMRDATLIEAARRLRAR